MIVEYIDMLTMGGMTRRFNLELGVPPDVQESALAYLVIVMENRSETRLEEDVVELAEHMTELGAIDVYVLPGAAGQKLIEAREKAFWLAKEAGADDIIDMVVPRAASPAYMDEVARVASESGSLIVGCGHAGDGNVHLSVFQGDEEKPHQVNTPVFAAGMALGGAISGEHGIGLAKKPYYLELEDPAKVALLRRIKVAFDPHGILNPGTVFDPEGG
jgi:glycolate oxidase